MDFSLENLTEEQLDLISTKFIFPDKQLINEKTTGLGFTSDNADLFINTIMEQCNGFIGDKSIIIVNDLSLQLTKKLHSYGLPLSCLKLLFCKFSATNKKVIIDDCLMTKLFSLHPVIRANKDLKIITLKEVKNMDTDGIIANPPYGGMGGPIIASAKEVLPTAQFIVLMPVSCYKTAKVNYNGIQAPLYQFVSVATPIGGKGFDAHITDNNCISILSTVPNKEQTYLDLQLTTFNQDYIEYYKWNIVHNVGIAMNQHNYIKQDEVSIDLDFLESSKVHSHNGGNGFTTGSFGYAYNFKKDITGMKWLAGYAHIHFNSKEAKENFAKAAYTNGRANLLYKTMMGTNTETASSMDFMALPQIDWGNIHNSQKALWDAGNYDEAILAEMNLEWQGDKLVKIGE